MPNRPGQMRLPPFRVHRPRSVQEASRLLAELGDEAAAYCGGTELLLAMKLGLADYSHLVDLKRIDGLRGVVTQDRQPAHRGVGHPLRARVLAGAAGLVSRP